MALLVTFTERWIYKMEIINYIRHNEDVAELLGDICDIYVLPEDKSPQSENGHLTYNIPGMTFARSGNGSEYILLEDNSIGYWGSEGKVGRISDDMESFWKLIVNCPYWLDYVDYSQYQSMEKLKRFINIIQEEHMEMFLEDMDIQIEESQKKLAVMLDIPLADNNVENILMEFYYSATRIPQLIATYMEDNGKKHSSSGSLFN